MEKSPAKKKKTTKKTLQENSRGDALTMADLLKGKSEAFQTFKKGDRVVAVISQITPKKVYFDLGGKTEGVIFGEELKRVRDYLLTLKEGEKVEVVVGSPEDARGQILVSLRDQAQRHAWDFFEEKRIKGEAIEVMGHDIVSSGILVEAPFFLTGFIPSSLLGKKWLGKEEGLLGKKFKVKVVEVDEEKNRLVFSERAVSEKEEVLREEKVMAGINKGDVLAAKIMKVAPYGLFVEVEKGKAKIEGLVHISEVSWSKVNNLEEKYQAGEKIRVKVLSKEGQRLQLSLKQLTADPWEKVAKKYPVDKEISGKISKITPYGWLVTLEEGVEGLVRQSKIPVGQKAKVGDKITCVVESADPQNRRLSLGLILKGKPVGYK
ncbi:30S ribosomal protein S1 [Candidatus Shapirobacteria bacterium]|nr:30S ribosomal protein S1 [Candidatus Shapirobacteria bacterium]